MTKKSESKALEQARSGLQAIIGELEALKPRLRAIADDLAAAEPLAVVIETDDHGDTYTVEKWISNGLGSTPRADLGGTVREDVDDLIANIAGFADFDRVRRDIHDFQ